MTSEGALLGGLELYRGLGWSIVPVAGKKPLPGWKWRDVVVDQDRVERAVSNPQTTGIAVILGRPSGDLFARDFDQIEAYEEWAREHRSLAATLPTSRTGRGFHVYGIAPGVRTQKFDDGEIRGAKALIVLPPSLTQSSDTNKSYQWLVRPSESIPAVDPKIFGSVNRLTDREAEGKPRKKIHTLHVFPTDVRELEERVDESIRNTLPTGYRQRNRKLWIFARMLARFIRKTRVSISSVRSFKSGMAGKFPRFAPSTLTRPGETS